MMEVLYYPYWNIAFIPGVFIFCLSSVLLIIALADPNKENSTQSFVYSFYLYFKANDGWHIFGKMFIVLVIHILLCPLSILIIYYYNPNFILIIFQLSIITYNLIGQSEKALYCIALYIIQFFVLMIHLEILELNFCGLNKYTKKNIEFRGDEDVLGEGRDSTASLTKIDINRDYYIQDPQKKGLIEMEGKDTDGEENNEYKSNLN